MLPTKTVSNVEEKLTVTDASHESSPLRSSTALRPIHVASENSSPIRYGELTKTLSNVEEDRLITKPSRDFSPIRISIAHKPISIASNYSSPVTYGEPKAGTSNSNPDKASTPSSSPGEDYLTTFFTKDPLPF